MISHPQQSHDRRVLFIIPGHQVAHDGISDYTFWLAAAFGRHGIHCSIFCLYPIEQEIAARYTSRFPANGSVALTVVQAKSSSLREKFHELSLLLRKLQPHSVSLQFTPGTFRHGRFFFPSICRLTRVLRTTPNLQITVHETGRILHPSPRGLSHGLAWIRRSEVILGLKRFKPKHIWVSNPQYHQELSRTGFHPRYLPIFSNITRSLTAAPPPHPQIPPRSRIIALFGRIDPTWDPLPAVAALASENSLPDRPFIILSIGIVGHRDQGWHRITQAADKYGIRGFQLGALDSNTISAWLQHATYGITSTPLGLWQKSSTCAAMIQHQLPIIFPGKPYDDEHPLPPRYALVRNGRLEWTTPPPARQSVAATADAACQLMARSFSSHSA